jgi:hypothetical protein
MALYILCGECTRFGYYGVAKNKGTIMPRFPRDWRRNDNTNKGGENDKVCRENAHVGRRLGRENESLMKKD